jgi:heme/copper-type cytochrome/quinol oxidase subunit 2
MMCFVQNQRILPPEFDRKVSLQLVVTIVAVVIVIGVEIAMYATRPRGGPALSSLEITWAVLPVLLVAVLVMMTFQVLFRPAFIGSLFIEVHP